MSDIALSEDQIVVLFILAAVTSHAVVLLRYCLSRSVTPVLTLHALTGGAVVAYWVPRLDQLFADADIVSAFVAFELAVFAISVAAFAGARVPRSLNLTALAANALLSAAALYFILTFKIDRLI